MHSLFTATLLAASPWMALRWLEEHKALRQTPSECLELRSRAEQRSPANSKATLTSRETSPNEAADLKSTTPWSQPKGTCITHLSSHRTGRMYTMESPYWTRGERHGWN